MAARYARADAAKQFLQCGADPNIKDIKGRTPLHAAIASDSYGVFTIILNDRNGYFTDSRKLVLYFKKLDRKSKLIRWGNICSLFYKSKEHFNNSALFKSPNNGWASDYLI